MARPEKNHVDYFPFYAKSGKTLAILENKYKATGSGFFLNVLRTLAETPDHHLCLEEEADKIYFYGKTLVEEQEGVDMLNLMSITGKIDRKLWEERQVIVSKDFLESIKDAYAKRQILIITVEQVYKLFGVEYEGKSEDTTAASIIKKMLSDSNKHAQIANMFSIPPSKVKIRLEAFLDQYGTSNMVTPKQIWAAYIKDLQRFKKIARNEQPTEGEM